jgi:hypothetical protein
VEEEVYEEEEEEEGGHENQKVQMEVHEVGY